MADIDTSEIDFDRVNVLLSVVHQAAGSGPKLTALGNAAMTELTKINDSIMAASRKNQPVAIEPLDLSGKPIEPDLNHKLTSKLDRKV